MIYGREEKMNWISGWIQGIIIAVIIGTIIEMLLPDGNCKKYVKLVIGVYILFSIVSPVITKVTGNEFRVSDIYDINTYIEVSAKSSQENIESSQQNQIKQVYITNLKNDMKQKIQEKGYSVKSLTLEISNDEQYTLKKIFAQVSKKKDEETKEVKGVNEINVTISNTTENIEEDISISTKEQNDLKAYLSGIYNLEEKNININ